MIMFIILQTHKLLNQSVNWEHRTLNWYQVQCGIMNSWTIWLKLGSFTWSTQADKIRDLQQSSPPPFQPSSLIFSISERCQKNPWQANRQAIMSKVLQETSTVVCTCLKTSTTGLRRVYFRMSLMINHEKMLLIRVQVLRQNFCPQILKDRPADSQRQHSAIYRQGG